MVSNGRSVLVVEDEADLRELLAFHLRKEGFLADGTANGYEAWQRVQRDRPEVILLDLMIDGLAGLQLCRQIRACADTARTQVIIISASTSEEQVLAGLEAGADDYIRKPFKVKEVVARVRAVLRRARSSPVAALQEEVLSFPPLQLDHARHEVRIADRILALTATEYGLLHHMMRHAGQVLNRGQLIECMGDGRSGATGRNIDVHIRALRRKLGNHAHLIDTARGFGYRFVPDDAPALRSM